MFIIQFLVLIGLQDRIGKLDTRVNAFECHMKEGHVLPTHSINVKGNPNQSAKKEEKEDDDIDLFGSDSDEESETAAKVREERLAAYNAKKSKSTLHLQPIENKFYNYIFFLQNLP